MSTWKHIGWLSAALLAGCGENPAADQGSAVDHISGRTMQ
jgi:hypothetical protein